MITSPGIMTTLSYVMEKLRLKRQDNEFIIAPEGFTIGNGKFYNPEDLTIIKTFRFEGASDPSDASILYVIESADGLIGCCRRHRHLCCNQSTRLWIQLHTGWRRLKDLKHLQNEMF